MTADNGDVFDIGFPTSRLTRGSQCQSDTDMPVPSRKQPYCPCCTVRRLHYILAIVLGFVCASRAMVAYAQIETARDSGEGSPLQIVTKEIDPFVSVGDELDGFSIELWQEIARSTGIEYEFVLVDTVGEQLDTVSRATADAAIAAISITETREEVVDFSYPYFASGLGILTQSAHAPSLVSALASGELLWPLVNLAGLLAIVIILAGHAIWLLERKRNEQFPRAYVAGLWEGIWWAAVTVTTVGYGDRTPIGRIGRIFGLLWMFAGLFIIANFTAAVTARLTVDEIQGSISGPGDLPGKPVASVEGSTGDVWLTQEGIPHRSVGTIDQAYSLLDSGIVQAVVYDYPVLRHHALNFGEGYVRVVGEPFNAEDYGIAFPEGSPLREEVNRALLRLREDGTYDRLHSEWFGD